MPASRGGQNMMDATTTPSAVIQPHEPQPQSPIPSVINQSDHDRHRQQQEQQQEQEAPPTKRRRIGYACNLCRAKKNRCDGEQPSCGQCIARRQECVYSPQRTRVSVTREYVENLRARNRTLEEHLASQQDQQLRSSYVARPYNVGLQTDSVTPSYSEAPFSEGPFLPASCPAPDQDGRDDGPGPHQYQTTLSPQSAPAGGEGRGELGRPGSPHHILDKRSSPRSGNNRHHYPPRANDDGSAGEYFGESSTFDFIVRVGSPSNTNPVSATTATTSSTGATTADTASSARLPPGFSGYPKCGPEAARGSLHIESLAGSSPSIVVFEEFLGGHIRGSNPFELPHRSLADKLVTSFFTHRYALNPYLHEGTFRRRYERLWLSSDAGGEEATAKNVVWLGLVNMVFAFGSEHSPRSVNTSAQDRTRFFGRSKTLVLSGILQAGKIELVQALLLMGHYLHGSLELNHCWTVVGLAVRTAQELGLCLDPAQFTADIVEQEIRKRVWWGCFVFDRQISTKVGRPPIIHDGPGIRIGLPIAVDDEFLDEASEYSQPENVPSKLEFLIHIVGQCRLAEKVLDTLYNSATHNRSNQNHNTGGGFSVSDTGRETEMRMPMRTDLPDLLAVSIQLDGALVAWQEGLPHHLRPDSEASEWHFERQRSVLLMRFLHTRLLIHRQTLLFYISRRISCPFQLDLIRLCIRRCVMAAYESITQMRLLRQRKSLSSFWHNSHYVFAALGVLLVYQKIDSKSRAEMGIPPTVDLDEVIAQGLENLQRVGGEMHPLASRYVQSFQQLQKRLQAITALSTNAVPQSSRSSKQPLTRSGSNTPFQRSARRRPEQTNTHANLGTPIIPGRRMVMVEDQRQDGRGANYYEGDVGPGQAFGKPPEIGGDPFDMPRFDDDFEILQSILLDSSDWPTVMDFD